MSTTTKPITQPMTVDEFEAMVSSGAFTKHDRLELIEGRLVEKMTKNPSHSTASEMCRRELDRLLPAGWHTRAEKPVRIPARASKPEPDISVARGALKTYLKRDPNPDDIALLVEVSDSSVAEDRAMAVTYGAAGIPVYWIINLRDRQVEVYTKPDPAGGYGLREDFTPGDEVPLEIDGRGVGAIPVEDLLP
jgi:Uma2 family endonuclease